MATPRHLLVDSEHPAHYHLVTRCVRGAHLCGRDETTGRDYAHRLTWVESRLFNLARAFPIELYAYAIMSNHLHFVVYYDPLNNATWTDEEVVNRWFTACPPKKRAKQSQAKYDRALARSKERMMSSDELLKKRRNFLGSLSNFMKLLKQPIAYRANREDGVKGHFFEQRFYSGALLDEDAVVAAMAYVDLNPVRARLVSDVAAYKFSSIAKRLSEYRNSPERLDAYLAPVVSGLSAESEDTNDSDDEARTRGLSGLTGKSYVRVVKGLAQGIGRRRHRSRKLRKQAKQVDAFRTRERVYGAKHLTDEWCDKRGFAPKGRPKEVSRRNS